MIFSKARELMSEAQSDPNHPIPTNLTSGCLISPNNLRLAMKIHKLIQNQRACDAAWKRKSHTGPFNSLKGNHNEAITKQ
jgi:hypothetical protein